MQKGTLFASTKSARRLEATVHFAILFSIANIQTVRWPGVEKRYLAGPTHPSRFHHSFWEFLLGCSPRARFRYTEGGSPVI